MENYKFNTRYRRRSTPHERKKSKMEHESAVTSDDIQTIEMQ